jgi:hypothetical protein
MRGYAASNFGNRGNSQRAAMEGVVEIVTE